MKSLIEKLLAAAVESLQAEGVLADKPASLGTIERTRDPAHGDFASNLAMLLSKQAGLKPRDLATRLVAALPVDAMISKVDIAGPGFINFFLAADARYQVVPEILRLGDRFGRSAIGAGKRVQVEFVSANPTGPLHVGHGRGAAYGAAVADLLQAVGYEVHREYYVNDAGRQMDILAASVWLRYLDLAGESIVFPTNAYQGDYVWDIAATLHREFGDAYRHPAAEVFNAIPADEPAGGDKEEHIDALIARAKALLGETGYRHVFDQGLTTILDDIRDDLELFGVTYQNWYSERSLVESGAVQRALDKLQAAGFLYEKDGALWFRSTDFGDEKDRVVVRDNGQATYFASDIAYHVEKFARGFDAVIDIWGADHHGYVPRVRAALQAAHCDADKLAVLLVQFAVLYRGGEKVQMSTRSGEFVTLRQLRKEVGKDAARFFYVMRKAEQHLDFDLDLATSQSSDNPVYYVQYAHARISSVLRQAQEKGFSIEPTPGDVHLELLTQTHEDELLTCLSRYPEVLEAAALQYEPHQLCHYLRELAHAFHTYYNAHAFLVDEDDLRDARLKLIIATRQVLKNGLQLLHVSTPDSM